MIRYTFKQTSNILNIDGFEWDDIKDDIFKFIPCIMLDSKSKAAITKSIFGKLERS